METEPDARPESPPVQVDERALMDIATNLPRYDRVDDIEAVGIFAELLEALQAYLTSAAPSLDKHDQPRLGATSHSERSQDKSFRGRANIRHFGRGGAWLFVGKSVVRVWRVFG